MTKKEQMLSGIVTAAEKVQSAIDKFFTDNNLSVTYIEAMLNEHMRTPYKHSQEHK